MGLLVILKDIFRPPILLFSLTIIALAVTLFAFSLSIEINKGKVLNPDIKSWNVLYKSVSALSLCLHQESKVKRSANPKEKMSLVEGNNPKENRTKVSFLAEGTFSIDHIKQDSYFIHGIIKAEDLGYVKSSDEIEITFSSSKITKKNHQNKGPFVCVNVVGPSASLPNGKIVLPKCSHPKKPPVEATFMTLEKVNDQRFCPFKHIGSLSLKEKESLNVYLSESDTRLIQLHIFATSSVLCAMIIIFFLYSLFGKLCRNDKKHCLESDMIPLES